MRNTAATRKQVRDNAFVYFSIEQKWLTAGGDKSTLRNMRIAAQGC
ncbi:hypothetical protein [Dickeya sp. NCPPB 3274]|nr:hypothetical protein [Dickeya sp. NCPPB 3274]